MPYQNRSPMQPQMQQPSMSFGSTPHLGQQPMYQGNAYGGGAGGFVMRNTPPQGNREYPPNQYVDEQGRYVQNTQPQQQQPYRESSPYQVHRTNSYSPMMANNGNNGGGYTDNFGVGDTGYQSTNQLPMQLHKNFLSRENLSQPFYNNSGNSDGYQGGQQMQPQSHQFYLHDQNAGSPPVAPQRRTWAQSAAVSQQKPMPGETSWSAQQMQQSGSPKQPLNNSNKGGFMLHHNGNDGDSFLNNSGNMFPVHTSSPQHNKVHRQISQMIDESTRVAEKQLQSRVSLLSL